MARRKDSPALFEALAKGRDGQGQIVLPEWLKKKAPPAGASNDPGASAGRGPTMAAPDGAGQAHQAPPVTQPRRTQSGPAGGRSAACAAFAQRCGQLLGQDRLRWVLLAVGVVAVLAAAYFVGTAVMSDEPAGPGDGNVGPVNPGTDAGLAGTERPLVRQAQLWYLFIQGQIPATEAGLAEAQRIVAFLAGKGEQADIKMYTSQSDAKQYYLVWSGKGFENRRSEQAKDFARKVSTQYGPEYLRLHGTYSFLQNDLANPFYLKGDQF